MYETHEYGGAFVVRWIGTPTQGTGVRGAVGHAPGTAPLGVVMDTARAAPPRPRARATLQGGAGEILGLAASVDIVVLGRGVGASLTRTLLRTMSVLARLRGRQRVHNSIEDAARGLALEPGLVAVLRGDSA